MTSGADARYYKSDDYVVAARILITSFPVNSQCWCRTVTLVCGWSEYAHLVWITCVSVVSNLALQIVLFMVAVAVMEM